jgi:hypothetical protein
MVFNGTGHADSGTEDIEHVLTVTEEGAKMRDTPAAVAREIREGEIDHVVPFGAEILVRRGR